MIGRKKLGAIREELQRTLTTIGDDPLRWLEERIAASQRQGGATSQGSEVLHSLRRVLETVDRKKTRKQSVGSKK